MGVQEETPGSRGKRPSFGGLGKLTTGSPERPVRLALVDDHLMVRQGLRALLEMDGCATVVAEAGSQGELLEVLDGQDCDCVLLDLRLPDSDGLSCLTALQARYPDLPVLMISMETDARVVEQALRTGARGFLPKSAGVEEIRQGLLAVMQGGIYLHHQLAGFLTQSPDGGRRPESLLSRREREVLRCVSHGMTNKQIAEALHLAPSTVKTHLRNLLDKTGAANRSELVYRTLTEGLLDDEP